VVSGRAKRVRAERFSHHLKKLDSVRENGLVPCWWDISWVCDWFVGYLGCGACFVTFVGGERFACPRMAGFVRNGVLERNNEAVHKLGSEWNARVLGYGRKRAHLSVKKKGVACFG